MKLDKETIVKQQFWVGIGVFILAILITLVYLSAGVAESNLDKSKKIEAKKNELEKLKKTPPPSDGDTQDQEKRRVFLEKRKEEIWELAWKMQEELMTWPGAPGPGSLQDTLGKMKFGEKIEENDLRDRYARKDHYDTQVAKMAEVFKTKVKIGDADKVFESIEFKGGARRVIHHVPDWFAKTGKAPSSEEVWLGQEDIWVQREVLNAILEANNTVARFKKVEGPAAAAGEVHRQQFENPYWQLDLVVSQNKDGKFALRGKIKNISSFQLGIGKLYFLVQMHSGNTPPAVLPVEGDTLPAGKDLAILPFPLDFLIKPDGLLGVTQLYEGRISPIRRVEQIALGAQAHRTFWPHLKMAPFSQGKSVEIVDKSKAPPNLLGDKARDGARTENGLARERYSEVTKQVRRYPVAVVLLVDQAHIPEVEAALANSKLRMQITQVGWQHYRKNLSEREDGAPLPAAGKEVEEDKQPNLVELVVYCVASLYERYQPKALASLP
jgi:hypothetical protein